LQIFEKHFHHEAREEHEVEGQEDYFLEAGFKPA
jgi:hypothetical protein